ncbi:hypothetical protein ABG088_00925 [Hydrogenibacillus schlegelii]|uniref:Uncharacterized protein n=1 Tax=Hydrogenibacillus schlegelii TaxID=1484 RepID=A0A2T5G6L0_HYDSH|nr:hypothetical protein [Hydrogenibacillus schlegelii]PTQ51815.1 MAG: hypothetical protein HSCHL_1152 [Hydrogenibacillus schlegelii]
MTNCIALTDASLGVIRKSELEFLFYRQPDLAIAFLQCYPSATDGARRTYV